jgi:hypothetical protein
VNIRKIKIEVISHLAQRYNTVGDWQFARDPTGTASELTIRVSDVDGGTGNMLIAIHELIEALLCEHAGVKETDVDAFDMNWTTRKAWWHSESSLLKEPGDDIDAPYYQQHQIASSIERMVAARMWVDWAKHEAYVDELVKRSEGAFKR